MLCGLGLYLNYKSNRDLNITTSEQEWFQINFKTKNEGVRFVGILPYFHVPTKKWV